MKVMLRGGIGNVYKPRPRKARPTGTEKDREVTKSMLEAQFEEEAVAEAGAIRQHRAMVPAREVKFQTA